HINFENLQPKDSYTSKNSYIPTIPARNPEVHGRKLLSEFQLTQQVFNETKTKILPYSQTSEGIYITLESDPESSLPLESIDNTDFILSNVRITKDKREEATIFIPEDKRRIFIKKITDYIDTIHKQKNPKNKKLINSIASIKLAELKNFWTDDLDFFPTDKYKSIWWELWIKKTNNDPSITYREVIEFSESIQAEIGNDYLDFVNNIVVLIKTSAAELEKSVYLMNNLLEVRQVNEPATFFVNLNEKEQYEWVGDLKTRFLPNPIPKTSVCILDSGINHDHPLISSFIFSANSRTYDPSWPQYDIKPAYGLGAYNPHGSMQAGIVIYGDLKKCLLSSNSSYINHIVESGRILPPRGSNKPNLYGSLTIQTANKVAIANNQIKYRIFSLAVTSENNNTGRPSSWSGAIDKFTFGELPENNKCLFIISAGNNRSLNVDLNIWDQAHLAKIEDPAHSWNSITVGTYTNLTTVTDPSMRGWSLWSKHGDLCPTTRTSVNWEWVKNAPLKPDFVLEGGNYLLSPPPTYADAHEDLSILTTSGDVNLPFECHRDSSAACALASNYAAQIADKYPNYWPETIRGLLIHSCQYTKAMVSQYNNLIINDRLSPKKAAEVLLRTVGYGVPNLEVALNSSNNHAIIVIQDQLKPFKKHKSDVQFNEMQVIQLPWPQYLLSKIGDKDVELKVTLSYFIEPNPQNKGFRSRFSYQSCGLRFKMIAPTQTVKELKASINRQAMYDEYEATTGNDSNNWFLGTNLRTKGSVHSDTWKGTAAELMSMDHIAIYPVTGWWKSSKAQKRWTQKIRYSLIISIQAKENISIYNEIMQRIESLNTIQNSGIEIQI
ncbi:TPA: S8 family peptidase, partial [Acinetobacter baumannii]